jgi:hypothetical protein
LREVGPASVPPRQDVSKLHTPRFPRKKENLLTLHLQSYRYPKSLPSHRAYTTLPSSSHLKSSSASPLLPSPKPTHMQGRRRGGLLALRLRRRGFRYGRLGRLWREERWIGGIVRRSSCVVIRGAEELC